MVDEQRSGISPADEGGDPPCWAHLMEESEPDGERTSAALERQQHPKVAAAVLMVGVVVLLVAVSVASIVW
jgi:hypothetical protein